MRFDSGYWSTDTIKILEKNGVSYTMAVRTRNKGVAKVVEAIPEEDWVPIDYSQDGEAQVAETTYKGRRLIIRRTCLTGDQATLWPDWRHFGFLTDLSGPATDVDAFHRERALCELDIRDLKEGGGHGALPLGELLGECRLDVLRGHSPQSHPLDSPLGWVDPRGGVPCRCTNSSDPLLRRAGATRESLGTPDTARTAWVAVAFQVPRCAHQLTLHRLRANLTISLAVGRGRRRLPTR